MNKDTGGSAFPCVPEHREAPSKNGMTLRDYFAAKALAGFLAGAGEKATRFHPVENAEWCYRIADAMLAERNKQPIGEGNGSSQITRNKGR